ncbi:hypothetical protein OTK49_01090 [Vibrio coralliirubri]|uniref:hypothetical protein n=1 Tax=Vibrio coralliirubri TaxID=1516159 RepID=UPI00228375F4|nr:hypothetical protein [Vibrio coralliirubri]MCY9861124.1 hypothetical protein [Vibrio coralliirubri]
MTFKTKQHSIWLELTPALLTSSILLAAWYWSTLQLKDIEQSYIYTHKVSATIGYTRPINHLDNGTLLSCELPTGTKIETTKALFSQSEIPNSPLFEISITYPDSSFINAGYTSYKGLLTPLVNTSEKPESIKKWCQHDLMTIEGNELDNLIGTYVTDTVLVAIASSDYYKGL